MTNKLLGSNFFTPEKYMRSKIISISARTELSCNISSYLLVKWFVYQVDPVFGNNIATVKLSSNPSINNTELVFQPNTLSYGVYKVIYQVTMVYSNVYSNQIEAFFEVIPSGLIISSLNNIGSSGGSLEITRGVMQSIVLNPVLYSSDIDAYVSFQNLKFMYYCQIIEDRFGLGFPVLYSNMNLDLFTLKQNYSSNLQIQEIFTRNNSQSCFDSIGK